MSSNDAKTPVIGIRREDKNRWERRVPLTPQHVKQLTAQGIKVIIQSSNLRTYGDSQYLEVGAVVQEDLSEASLIVAVKEVPIELLIPNMTYLFFSHTIKAQPYNMRMLDTILAKNIRLIDYEGITDDKGARLVRFGKFAGYAGCIDTLHALGDRLLALGHSTPFLHLGYSYCYSNLEAAKQAVAAMGEEIAHYGLPKDLTPLTFVITSNGNVSQGAQEIFRLLPHKMLSPTEMADLVKNKEKASPFMVYGCVVTAEDFMEPIDSSAKFNKAEYYATPEKYKPVFYEKIAPYSTVILNCMFWNARFPRLLTNQQVEEMFENGTSRLIAVGDISCDPSGSIECLLKTTSIDQPLFVYDPYTHEAHDNTTDKDWIYREGILFCAVDNFPTEFPKEASQWFGDHLLPFIPSLLKADQSKPYEEQSIIPPEMKRAVLASHGKLTAGYEYIWDLRKANEKTLRNIIVFGAGFVAGAAVDYLSRNPKNTVTVVDIDIKQAMALTKDRANCIAMTLDISDEKAVDAVIASQNVVISLLPASLGVIAAEACVRHKKQLVTASYISSGMKALDAKAKEAGLTFLNEMGLDPGIDHLEALRVIETAKQKGGKIRSFVSWCGGIPMPESSCNPLAYKFSWSPRGVLVAATKDAKYMQDNRVVDIPGNKLFTAKQPVTIFPGFNLEGLPNRDSIVYADEYGIKDTVHTMFRGTLRYSGYSEIMEIFGLMGFFDETPQPFLATDAAKITWNELLRKMVSIPASVKVKQGLRQKLHSRDGFPSKGHTEDQIRRTIACLDWLGLLSDNEVVKKGSYLDCLCYVMNGKMQYEKWEKDMILLHHIFEIEWPNGSWETKTSTLVVHGKKNQMAMGRSVGLPVGIAAELIMNGVIQTKGVIGPMSPEIYVPVLKALSKEGMRFVEQSTMRQ